MLNLNWIIHIIENTAWSLQADRIFQDEVIPKAETIVTDFRAYVLIHMCPTIKKNFFACIRLFKMEHIRKYTPIYCTKIAIYATFHMCILAILIHKEKELTMIIIHWSLRTFIWLYIFLVNINKLIYYCLPVVPWLIPDWCVTESIKMC